LGTVFALLFNRGVLRVNPHNPADTKIFGATDGVTETAAGIVRGPSDSIYFTFGSHLANIDALTGNVQVDSGVKIPDDRVVALLFDADKTLWLRTATHLARIDTEAHKLNYEEIGIGTANEEEGKPTVDQHGEILVPTSTGLYWRDHGRWRVLTDQQGLSSNNIQGAIEDREETLWVAGSGTGLDRLPGVREWSAWTTAEGLPDNATWATLRDRQGRLWVSTVRGIGIWDPRQNRWQTIPSLGGPSRSEVRQIQLAADGSVWALTGSGSIVRIDPKTLAISVCATFNGRSFLTIAASPQGDIWATTRARLVRFDFTNPKPQPIDVPVPIAEGSDIEYLSFSPGGVLWATGPGVLYRYDGGAWRKFTSADGLQGQAITSLTSLNNNDVWIGYNDVVKVSHVRLDERGSVSFDNHDWDWNIIGRDSKSRVWFDGTDGIAVLSPGGGLQRFTHADGLLWDDISPWTGVREEPDGSYLIATSRGLSRYQPAAHPHQEGRPHVALTSVVLGGVERRLDEPLEVSSAAGNLTVQFTPMIFDNPERISCTYQLDGLEKEPSETSLREVRYGKLPPGKYEFWVQCQQPVSKLISARTSVLFRVLPTFWQSAWAKALFVLALLGGMWGLVIYRTRRLNRRRVELEQAIAQRSAELLQKNKELEEISLTDPLTNTRNRRYFYETISTDIAQALRSHLKTIDPKATPGPRQELIFILVDIDRFKRVNDDLGHAAGDHLLREVAKRIASVMRRSDDLVRWGGEEFLLVCRTTDRDNASLLCNRVLEAIRDTPFDVGNGVQIHKTCSIGWAPFPWFQDDVGLLSIDNVIELADKALYLSKREGRNRAYGMVPSPTALQSERSISIENLRDCPPDLVQIV
jgi:diguanylate cyclase (GGDEF)-like protein